MFEIVSEEETMVNKEKKKEDKNRTKFKITFNTPEDPNEPHPLQMINASLKSGTPIDFTGKRISSIEIDGKTMNNDYGSYALKILPGQILNLNVKAKNVDCGFNNLIFRAHSKGELLTISTDDTSYPYKIGFNYNFKMEEGNFNLGIDSNANVEQLFKWETFLRTLNKEGILCLTCSKTNERFFGAHTPHITVGNDKWYNYLKKLCTIQKETGQKLILGNLSITRADLKTADQIMEILDTSETKINVDNLRATFKVNEIKRMIKIRQNNKAELPIMIPNYPLKLNLLNKEINVGSIIMSFPDFKILDETELISKIEELKDDDSTEIKLYPKNGEIKVKKD